MENFKSEEQLQAACFQWFWNTYPEHRQMLFHVQQKARNAIEGSRFKAIGVVKGVSDLVLILRGKVVFIEMKMPGQKQFEEQETFAARVTYRGHQYRVVTTLEDFKTFVNSLL